MRYFIKTFGCQMNKADSERIAGALEAAGMAAVDSMEEAEVIIINTCSVRQASEDKVFGLTPKIREVRSCKSEVKVLVTGCVVGSGVGNRKRTDLADLKRRLPWVDYFVPCGENQAREILKVLGIHHPNPGVTSGEKSPRDRKGILRSPDRRAQNDGVTTSRREKKEFALVPISYGCDHFCSYCVVPYARGEEKSRPFEEIVCEVERLVENGVEEVMLLGQNVNTYGKDFSEPPSDYESIQSYKELFPRLLARLSGIKGLKKIEFLTSHPRDMSYELIDAIASLPKVSKYLHLPVQSGDNEILKKMNRGYTAQDYINLVRKIRKKVPNLRLGTDVIVGFPGETKGPFENTVKLFKKVKFDVAFIAMYSPRPGTAAAKLEDNVPKKEKKRRYRRLREVFDANKRKRAR